MCITGTNGCGGIFTTAYGTMSAPEEGSDKLYPNNAYCLWYLYVFEDKAIQIRFHEMDIEEDMVCEYDYIKVSVLHLHVI